MRNGLSLVTRGAVGLGDWIMATSQVRTLNERTGKRVVVVDRLGRIRWSDAFDGNPRVVRPGEITAGSSFQYARLLNAGGSRPYIRAKTDSHWFWQRWDIRPGELYLTDEEFARGAVISAGAVIVEPNTKVTDGNKAWPFERWQRLVDAVDVNWVQVGASGSRRLAGRVRFVETTVREAFAALASARLFVGTEGALHHAAAALGTPAVVLWSEFISPVFTGYASQRNIRKTTAVCGARHPCASCRAAMEAIPVEEVEQAIREELAK